MIGTGQRERSEGWLTESQRAGRAAYDWFARNLGSKTIQPSITTPPHSIPWPARRHPLVHLVLSFDIDWPCWPRLHPGHTNSTIVLSYRSSCDLQSAKKSSREGFVPANPSSHTATTFPSVPPSGPSKTPLRLSVTSSLSLSHATRISSERAAAGSSSRVFPFKIRFTTAGIRPLDPFLSPFLLFLSLKGLHVLPNTQPLYNHINQNHTETSLHDPFTTTLARSRIIKSIIVTLRSKVFLSAYRSRLITSC
jgi:hypothetical protein